MNENKDKGTPREELKTSVIELLQEHSKNNSRSIAIAINGNWGVGKSYMYRESLAVKIQEVLGQKPIYTSVFGKKDENEIIQDLVAQFLKKENLGINKMKAATGAMFKLLSVNVDTGFIFSHFEKDDLHNTIVCIDDFERLSDKIPMQDILGLISELKENKGCHIILLCSEDHIGAEQKSAFYHYKEKIIDFDYTYKPEPMEQLEIFKGSEEYERYIGKMTTLSSEDYPSIGFVLNYFRVVNIREIRKLIFYFNAYCEHLKNIIENEEIYPSLIRTIFLNTLFVIMVQERMFYRYEEDKELLKKDYDCLIGNKLSPATKLQNASLSPKKPHELQKNELRLRYDGVLFNRFEKWRVVKYEWEKYKVEFSNIFSNSVVKKESTKIDENYLSALKDWVEQNKIKVP